MAVGNIEPYLILSFNDVIRLGYVVPVNTYGALVECDSWEPWSSQIKMSQCCYFYNKCHLDSTGMENLMFCWPCINESTATWYTFLSLFIRSQCLYMFRALLSHLQEALHRCCLVLLRAYDVCWLRAGCNLQHTITPNSNCAEPPEDGRVMPETCRGIDS
jgi:hypothetical protein